MNETVFTFIRPLIFTIILSAILSFFMTRFLIKFADKYKLYDEINERKVHNRKVPRIGGVAIFSSLFLSLFIGEIFVQKSVFSRPHNMVVFIVYLLSLIVIFLLGLLDDLKGLNAPQKFSVQFTVALILYFAGFKIKLLSLPTGGALNLGFLSLPVTLIWIVGVINAINIIDGLDGLAAGISLCASISMLILLSLKSQLSFAIVLAALIGAIVGFLPYNLNPAKIFMGDSGSLFIGLILSTLALKSSEKASLTVSLSVAIVILFIPIVDTLLAILRRAINHKPLFSADRDHIHHRLLDLLHSHRAASNVLILFSAFFSGLGLLMAFASSSFRILLLFTAFTVIIVFLVILGYLKKIDLGYLFRNGRIRTKP